MDIFKQKKILVFTIIVLVILNVASLLMLWTGKPDRGWDRKRGHPFRDGDRIENLLKRELGFSDDQAKKYISLRKDHRKKTRQINHEVRELKRQMFDQAMQNDNQSTISDSLLILTQTKQAEIEKITFNHFLDLKEICEPDQLEGLKKLMHKLYTPSRHGQMDGPPFSRGDGPRKIRD